MARAQKPEPMGMPAEIALTQLRWDLTSPIVSAARVPALHGAMQANAEITAIVQAAMAMQRQMARKDAILEERV